MRCGEGESEGLRREKDEEGEREDEECGAHI